MAEPSPLGTPSLAVGRRTRHDLRTPLNQIIGYSELLADEAASSGREDMLPDLRIIGRAARELADLLEKLFAAAIDSETSEVARNGESDASEEIAASPAPERAEPRGAPREGAGGTILVVDDQEANRDVLSRSLERQGYRTAMAENGAVALKLLAAETFDLILLDIMMPEMDGYEALARLKADPVLRNIPVIVISAQSELDGVVRGIELGAEDYLPKPFNPVLLKARVNASLEKKRLREQEQAHREETLRSEAALERHRALTQMVAGVAHEINTPLGIASTALSVIQNRLASPRIKALFETSDEHGETLADILDAADLLKSNVLRAHRLIETFKKISVSQITENLEAVDLPGLVRDVVELFRINARQAKLAIAVDASGVVGDPSWLGYPGYLTQVIMNFLQNIERYAYPDGEGGKVDIRVEDGEDENGARFTIKVGDYGAGIGAENLARIFDPFFTTGRGKGGSGLGLAIVNNIVTTALKGGISVSSRPGEGTRFTVVFPKSIPDPD